MLPTGLCVAAHALFEEANLHLPYPQLSPKATGTTVLIWGASSSSGSCCVQLARAAGCDVLATCSAKNMPYCNELGADAYDYKSETIVEDLVSAFKGKQSAGIFCAVFDEASIRKCAEVADKVGGNKFVATVAVPGLPMPDNLPEGVKIGFSTYPVLWLRMIGAQQ